MAKMNGLEWRLYPHKRIWRLYRKIHRKLRDWRHNIKWKLAYKLIGNVYEVKPNHTYVLILNKPLWDEIDALTRVIADGKGKDEKWLIWGPGLQIKDLKSFLEEYHLIDEEGRVIFSHDEKQRNEPSNDNDELPF